MADTSSHHGLRFRDEAVYQCPNLELVVPAHDMRIDDDWHVLGLDEGYGLG